MQVGSNKGYPSQNKFWTPKIWGDQNFGFRKLDDFEPQGDQNAPVPSTLVNPRPAGPLDFPPPAGGGGRLNAPPHDLGSWSP